MSELPIKLGVLDHYTLIVPDAKAAARFHVEVLGFRYLRSQPLNAGSAPEGEFDMLNEVLEIGSMPGRTCVITEGLTETSIFRRYLNRYGSGVHHIAYSVERMDDLVAILAEADIKLTSERIIVDPLSGLRQVFIDRRHAGYFIELVERTPASDTSFFAAPNMVDLARSIAAHLDANVTPQDQPPTISDPEIELDVRAETVRTFLLAPGNLVHWTCHRTVRKLDGQWREVRVVGDILVETRLEDDVVVFRWSHEARELVVRFAVVATSATTTTVRIGMPVLDQGRLRIMTPLLQAELRLLKGLLEGRPGPSEATDRQIVADHHLRIYQRAGL